MGIADPHPRLLTKRRVEIRDGTLENSTRRTTQPRIVLVSHLREGRGRCFAEDAARAPNDIIVSRLGAELEGERRIVVLGEESEKYPASEDEGRRLTTPAVLGKSSHRRNRSDVGEVGGVSPRK